MGKSQFLMGKHHFLWENSLQMAIFNSYVTLPGVNSLVQNWLARPAPAPCPSVEGTGRKVEGCDCQAPLPKKGTILSNNGG